jgi:hypothetical protein
MLANGGPTLENLNMGSNISLRNDVRTITAICVSLIGSELKHARLGQVNFPYQSNAFLGS